VIEGLAGTGTPISIDTSKQAVAEAALRVHVEVASAAEQDARMAKRFCAAHPDVAVVEVPALPVDVHDLDGLRTIGDLLAAGSTQAGG
jgi:hypothetical protein